MGKARKGGFHGGVCQCCRSARTKRNHRADAYWSLYPCRQHYLQLPSGTVCFCRQSNLARGRSEHGEPVERVLYGIRGLLFPFYKGDNVDHVQTRGNQRDIDRARAQKRKDQLAKGNKDDNLTPLQRKER